MRELQDNGVSLSVAKALLQGTTNDNNSTTALQNDFQQLQKQLEALKLQFEMETEQQKKESEKLKKKTEELVEEVAYLRLTGLQSLTHLAVYKYIESHSSFKPNMEEVFKDIPFTESALVNHLWKNCTKLLPKHLPPANAHETEYQRVIEQVFSMLLSKSDHLQVHIQRSLYSPDKTPDLCITSKYDVSVAWQNLLVPVEVETMDKMKEGIGQAASYLSIALRLAHRPTGICIVTNCYTIDFIQIRVESRQAPLTVYHTGAVPFLSHEDSPSQGFSLLVRILQSNPSQLGAIMNHPTSETLGIPKIKLTKFIAFGTTSHVYGGVLDNEELAIKVQLSGHQTLEHEFKVLQHLNQVAPACSYFPEVCSLSTKLVLVTKPLGISIQNMVAERKFTLQQAMTYMCDLIDGLEKAHSLGWYHHDIRPSNIILVKNMDNDNRAVLIDWGNATSVHACEETFHGTPAYSASSILRKHNKAEPYCYHMKYEFESLAYTFLFMLLGHLPWHRAQTVDAILAARNHVHEDNFSGKQEYLEFLQMAGAIKDASHINDLREFCKKRSKL
eukprot:CAMPEP_0168557768 /NCGR_PEP_ID=MMETSP0413-20121227/9606_1 /TAXON_ID=136452 /ORGANISM="Filamoeba nolandi, Strain NC-AS-23-1" /LENGTH=557 /DNA_ID=CAMNT_0008588831 /DNA_START=63 /DNA_END=1736 /DNA_ORIENTATION=-